MTEVRVIHLSELIVPTKTDSISGRRKGQGYALQKNILESVLKNEKINIVIDETKIKAINDSFIKGFFSGVFEKLRTKENVKSLFTIQANDYFKTLFDKNFTILDSIYNS